MTYTSLKMNNLYNKDLKNFKKYLIDLVNYNLTDHLYLIYSEEYKKYENMINNEDIEDIINDILFEEYFIIIGNKNSFLMAPFFNDEIMFVHNDKFTFTELNKIELVECKRENWEDSFENVKEEIQLILK